MPHFTTGWFQPRKTKARRTFYMVCLENDCGHIWNAARVGTPCPRCCSRAVIPADKWDFHKRGILALGKVVGHG